ncbi:MAG: hypothetical protein AB1898_27475 [Acidobacteriota bacterium]
MAIWRVVGPASRRAAQQRFDPRPLAPAGVSDTRVIRALNSGEMQIATVGTKWS